MALETANFIDGLVSSNPAGSDGTDQGDDHIRLIKAVLKSTFPNLTGALTATQTQINGFNSRIAAIEADYVGAGSGAQVAQGDIDMDGNSIVDLATPTAMDEAANKQYVDDAIASAITTAKSELWPVGSIFIDANSSNNPNTTLGFGTWTAVSQGRVLVGVGTGTDSEAEEKVVTLGETGGRYSSDILLAAHSHGIAGDEARTGSGGQSTGLDNPIAKSNSGNGNQDYEFVRADSIPINGADELFVGASQQKGTTDTTQPNIQPYLGVHIWRRTA